MESLNTQESFKFYEVVLSGDTTLNILRDYVKNNKVVCFVLSNNFKLYLSHNLHNNIYREMDQVDIVGEGYFKVSNNDLYIIKNSWHTLSVEKIPLIKSVLQTYLKKKELI